jgi:catechol 2,3-dioxygenase-like lactoylglutathione lyase family enzyme
MELTFPRGSLTEDALEDIDAFWCGVFGWRSSKTTVMGKTCHMLHPDDGHFILLAESGTPMHPPRTGVKRADPDLFLDHLGMLCETVDAVDELFAACERFQEKDEQVELIDFPVFKSGNLTVRAFYLKYLLPIWFDIQCLVPDPGTGPDKTWRYV